MSVRISGEHIKVVALDELNARQLVDYALVGFGALPTLRDRERFATKILRVVGLGYEYAAECGLLDETFDYLEAQHVIGEISSEAIYGDTFRSFND